MFLVAFKKTQSGPATNDAGADRRDLTPVLNTLPDAFGESRPATKQFTRRSAVSNEFQAAGEAGV